MGYGIYQWTNANSSRAAHSVHRIAHLQTANAERLAVLGKDEHGGQSQISGLRVPLLFPKSHIFLLVLCEHGGFSDLGTEPISGSRIRLGKTNGLRVRMPSGDKLLRNIG
jgi:hypothetical protein